MQVLGMTLEERDVLNMVVIDSDKTQANSFKIRPGILSEPDALWG
jgi:hypothetical protein